MTSFPKVSPTEFNPAWATYAMGTARLRPNTGIWTANSTDPYGAASKGLWMNSNGVWQQECKDYLVKLNHNDIVPESWNKSTVSIPSYTPAHWVTGNSTGTYTSGLLV